jgi:hypothetical protein
MTFEEWIVKVCGSKKPLKQPYDDWYVCMQEAWKAGQENVTKQRYGGWSTPSGNPFDVGL